MDFHPNPQVRKMHDQSKPPGAKPMGDTTQAGEQGEPGPVELHKEGGKYHTIHQPSGERKDHASASDAHKAMNEHFNEDGCQPGMDMEAASNPEGSEY